MRAVIAFVVGMVGSLIGLATFVQVLSGGVFSGRALTAPGFGSQVAQLLFVASFFFGLVTALILQLRQNPDTEGIAGELEEGASNLVLALLLLRRRAFFPLWISLLLVALGLIGLASPGFRFFFNQYLACLPILAGQALWFFARERSLSYIGTNQVRAAYESPLRSIVLAADALFLLSAWPVVEALAARGRLESGSALSAAAASLALGFLAAFLRARRQGVIFSVTFPLAGLFLSLWFSLVLLSCNHSVALSNPVELGRVSKQDCIQRRTAILAGTISGTEDPGPYRACLAFDPPGTTHHLNDQAVTYVHTGGLGLCWRSFWIQRANGS